MPDVHEPKVTIEEVISVLTPAPGVSLEQMLIDAQLDGYQAIEVDGRTGQVTVRWFRRRVEE